MRVMAIDYGDSRTGIAVSDATRSLTGDAWVIHCKIMRETAQMIAGEAAARDVSCIVVGYPKNMDGSVGASARKSEQLAELLRSLCPQEVKLWDERLTTKEAAGILDKTGKHGQARKQTIDAVAASLILNSYLESL